jgi:hypothetical protein
MIVLLGGYAPPIAGVNSRQLKGIVSSVFPHS